MDLVKHYLFHLQRLSCLVDLQSPPEEVSEPEPPKVKDKDVAMETEEADAPKQPPEGASEEAAGNSQQPPAEDSKTGGNISPPDNKVHEACMGLTWGRQDPGGPPCWPHECCYQGPFYPAALNGSGVLLYPERAAGQKSPVNTLTSIIFHGSFSSLARTFITLRSQTSSIMEVLPH